MQEVAPVEDHVRPTVLAGAETEVGLALIVTVGSTAKQTGAENKTNSEKKINNENNTIFFIYFFYFLF